MPHTLARWLLRRPTPATTFHPHLDRLEDRTTPTTLTWDGSASNLWSNANNWTPAQVPQNGDDLVFAVGQLRSAMSNDLPGTLVVGKLSFTSATDFRLFNGSLQVAAIEDTTVGGFTDIRSALSLTGSDLTISVADDTSTVFLAGSISGDKGLTVADGFVLMDGEIPNTYTGTTTVAGGAVLQLDRTPIVPGVPTPAIRGPLVANGTVKLFRNDQIDPDAPVTVGGLIEFKDGASNTLNSPITLQNGGAVVTGTGTLTLGTTGGVTTLAAAAGATVSGKVALTLPAHAITVADGTAATDLSLGAVLSGPGGIVKGGDGVAELTQANTYTGPTVLTAGTLVVRGTQPGSPVRVAGGTLGGRGTVGPLTVTGGTVNPGAIDNQAFPATLRSGNLIATAGTFAPRIGTDAADRLAVTGTVGLANIALAPIPSDGVPLSTTPIVLIENDGTDAVAGTFAGLAEGAVFVVGGQLFTVTYQGGDGNDVVLMPVTVSIADAAAKSESAGRLTFTVTLSVAVPSDLVFTVATNGTATAGSDFTAPAGTLTIPAGQTSAVVSVALVDDAAPEANETVDVTLGGTSAVAFTRATGTGIILNDDNLPSGAITIANAQVNEGGPGAETPMRFTVTLNAAQPTDVTVNYVTTSNLPGIPASQIAQPDVDYRFVGGALTIPAGQTSAVIEVTALGDNVLNAGSVASNLVFDVVLVNSEGTVIASARGEIVDDEVIPPAIITIANAEVNEGSAGTETKMLFTVTLDSARPTPVTVSFNTTSNLPNNEIIAQPDVDYRVATGTLTIPAGQTSGVIEVAVLGDERVNLLTGPSNLVFGVVLSNPVGGVFAGGTTLVTARGTIVDDDRLPPTVPPTVLPPTVFPVTDTPIAIQPVVPIVVPFENRRTFTFPLEIILGRDGSTQQFSTSFILAFADQGIVPTLSYSFLNGDTRRGDGIVLGVIGDVLLDEANDVNGRGVIQATVTVTLPEALRPGSYTVMMEAHQDLIRAARQSFSVTVLGDVPDTQFVAGSDLSSGSVRFFAADKTAQLTAKPFGDAFAGGVRTATADFNGDSTPDIVVGTGPGVATKVLLLDGKTGATMIALPAFEAAFTGGVFVAAGDLDGDGRPEIVISPDEGGGPRVRVFSSSVGNQVVQLADFFGIEDPNFRGGVRPAIGDINGDGVADLVVAAGFTGGPRVAAFDGKSLVPVQQPDGTSKALPRKLFGDFFAFEPELANGVFVAVGDLDGDNFGEVICGGGPGGGPRVQAFSGQALVTTPSGATRPTLTSVTNFFAGPASNRGGVRLAVKNLDGDQRADLIVGDGQGDGNRVRAYLGKNVTPDGIPLDFELETFADYSGGVFVG